jgi:carbon storage regulator
MLVISRKLGERIIIAGNISVKVLEVGKGRVKLGVHAPPDVPIHREEILARIEGHPSALDYAGCA